MKTGLEIVHSAGRCKLVSTTVFKCIDSLCVFMFVGKEWLTNFHLHRPVTVICRLSCNRVTGKLHPKQTPRCFCFSLDSCDLEFLFSNRRSLSMLTCIDLARHVGVRPHLKLAQESCLAETDTATWICTLAISYKVDYWSLQTDSTAPTPTLFLEMFPGSKRPKAVSSQISEGWCLCF